MIEMIIRKMLDKILGNKVNIQLAYLLVKMISHTTHRMKTMTLEKLIKA